MQTKKAIISPLLFCAGLALSVPFGLVTGDDALKGWYVQHRTSTFIATGLLFLLSLILSYLDAIAESPDGVSVTPGSTIGAALAGTVTWMLIGGAVGMAFELGFSALVQQGFGSQALTGALRAAGPMMTACAITGAMVGARMRFLYGNDTDALAVVGMIVGVVTSIPAANHGAGISGLVIAPNLSIGPVALTCSLFAGVWALVTSMFKVGYDQRKARLKRQAASDRDRLQIAVGRLASAGFSVKSTRVEKFFTSLDENRDPEDIRKALNFARSSPFWLFAQGLGLDPDNWPPFEVTGPQGEVHTLPSVAAVEEMAANLPRIETLPSRAAVKSISPSGEQS